MNLRQSLEAHPEFHAHIKPEQLAELRSQFKPEEWAAVQYPPYAAKIGGVRVILDPARSDYPAEELY